MHTYAGIAIQRALISAYYRYKKTLRQLYLEDNNLGYYCLVNEKNEIEEYDSDQTVKDIMEILDDTSELGKEIKIN